MNAYPPGIQEIEVAGGDARVRVFFADLDAIGPPSALLSALSHDERGRVSRYSSPVAAASFIRRRWLRTCLLAAAHGLEIPHVVITSDRLGRPSIVSPPALCGLSVSTSSAGRYALVAWTPTGPIGVDIAHVNAEHVSFEAARIFMTPAELDRWAQNGGGAEHFFQCWTRKEAILKAMGTGFATDPTTVEAFASGPGQTAGSPVTAMLPAPKGWVAALTVCPLVKHAKSSE